MTPTFVDKKDVSPGVWLGNTGGKPVFVSIEGESPFLKIRWVICATSGTHQEMVTYKNVRYCRKIDTYCGA